MFTWKCVLVLKILCFLHTLGPPVHAARILGVFTLLAKSHHQFIHPLMSTLAEAGHDVTVYSHFPHSNPPGNYTDVYLGDVPNMDGLLNNIILDTLEVPYWKGFDIFFASAPRVIDVFFKNEKIKELLNSNEKYDLIVSETFAMQEFTLIFGHIFKAPAIGIQSFVPGKVLNRNLGNSLSLSHIPDVGFPFPSIMSFSERLMNTVFSLRALWFVYDYKYLSLVERGVKEHFPDIPSLQILMDNVALVFVNDHLTADYAQPWTPNIIPVSGIHIGNPKPLPNDLQKFMDNAPHGVILFSLGTYVPDDLRPKEYFRMFSRVFSRLPQKVLWKTRKEDIDELTDNVKIVNWLPQRDILAHPNCVLFITHGGLLSQIETIHSAVPVVVIPHVFDQHRNAKLYEEQGVGVSLVLNQLSESGVRSAVEEVLSNQKYKTNMKRLSSVFRDRPLSPRETVVYWTEYVLRHGAAHLRPPSTRLAWYQLALLDILAVLAGALVAVAVAVYCVVKTTVRVMFRQRNTQQTTKKCN